MPMTIWVRAAWACLRVLRREWLPSLPASTHRGLLGDLMSPSSPRMMSIFSCR
jgi:hypothetical protein